MYHVLEVKEFPKADDCIVKIEFIDDESISGTSKRRSQLILSLLLLLIVNRT
jgi:hypothetical protein